MPKYTERPKRGNARRAWDRYVKEMGEEPMEVYYSPNYDREFKGWVCEMNITDPQIKHLHYGGASCHKFYQSADL